MDNPLEEFVKDLRKSALKRGVGEDDVRRALRLYRAYYADLLASREPAAHDMPEAVDALLDEWEAALTDRYDSGSDDGFVPEPFATYEHMAYAAFAEAIALGEEE